ncbi:hypothetical protein R3P93_17920 [Rhodococcus cerastii]|uniref:Serine kinase n=1 Tax=Rhodococcus cerastii TaxID=908616 RepID=A0ABU4D5R3_9NOCA|nr:hypothetical protein [Rhodococcus cerastii]MDV6304441.1 hypothetical protein [Rhodococcus cerastii]
MNLYRAHGYTISSDLDLKLPLDSQSDRRVGLSIVRGEPNPVPQPRSGADVPNELVDEGGRGHRVEVLDGETRFLVPAVGHFVASADSSVFAAHPDPQAKHPYILDVMAAGALIAMWLGLRGHTVLHASAAKVGRAAVAVVGPSGSGKSTVAALLSEAGYPLISDDLLRVDLKPNPTVFVSASELRLRANSASLCQGSSVASYRETSDGRTAVSCPTAVEDNLPLRAIVFPLPRRDIGSVVARRMASADALKQLLAAPRMLGWVDHGWLLRNFREMSQIAATVECWQVQIPWGPPFEVGLGQCIIEAITDSPQP